MVNGSGVSRGDGNRNARLSRLREAVPMCNAIVGIDLADRKQMVVVADHDSRVLARTRRLGAARFERAVRKEVVRRGKVRPCLRIVGRLFAALTDPAGVTAHRPGAFERLAWTLQEWDDAKAKLADTEQRMGSVLDQLGLTELVASIDGLSAVGAAAILAETGDLNRFTSAGPWSNTPASPPASGCRAPSPAEPASPAPAVPDCGSPHGERYGVACKPTACTPPATGT